MLQKRKEKTLQRPPGVGKAVRRLRPASSDGHRPTTSGQTPFAPVELAKSRLILRPRHRNPCSAPAEKGRIFPRFGNLGGGSTFLPLSLAKQRGPSTWGSCQCSNHHQSCHLAPNSSRSEFGRRESTRIDLYEQIWGQDDTKRPVAGIGRSFGRWGKRLEFAGDEHAVQTAAGRIDLPSSVGRSASDHAEPQMASLASASAST